MYTVAIIGFGSSGARFLRSVVGRERTIGDVKLMAVCDTNKDRLAIFESFPIKIYSDVAVMLSENEFDILIVATNETSHFDVLRLIHAHHSGHKRIIVEKLLVEHIDQAKRLADMYRDDDIAVHFVERHSPIIAKLKRWMVEYKMTVSRASFFWGKYRLYDHRPTIGVISEFSHPIDLVLMLAEIDPGTPFEIVGGTYLFSDFSISGSEVMDTIQLNMRFGNLIVNGSSSFLWERRRREITLFFSNLSGKVTHMAQLVFDNPRWDFDSCTIYSVNQPNVKSTIVLKWEITNDDQIHSMPGINKTIQFIDDIINEITGGRTSPNLSKLSQSIYVQEIIDSIICNSACRKIVTPIFGEKLHDSEKYGENDSLLLDFLHGKETSIDFSNLESRD